MPTISDDNSAFGQVDELIRPDLAGRIGSREARRNRVREVCAVVEGTVANDPAALLDRRHLRDERTEAVYHQRLAWVGHAG